MAGSMLGPYRLERELGSGGMGKVWLAVVEGRAQGLDVGARVALKLVHPHLLETPGFFKRFMREAEIGRRVVHENVVRTLDVDALLVDGRACNFLVMEYVEGQTLRSLLAEMGRVPEELCRHVGREVAKGLGAIHAAGVVHRDLKPENVLVTKEHVVKVMDLGVAHLADEAIRLSQTGSFIGSVHYAAPEQFKGGDADLDGRADLHALGLILYELATAQRPYQADDFRATMRKVLEETPRPCAEINPQLSPFFEEVVQTLLAKDRDKRVATAGELARILDEGEAGEWWKGRAKAIRAETHRPLRRARVPRETALYGREAEIAKLRALYEKAKAGEGQVLLVEGEAGIGKSRLVDEFIGVLRQSGEDPNFLFGSHPPGGAATASGAFSAAYREHFGSESLEETLAAYLRPTPALVPAFAALLRGETTPTGAEPLTKDSLQTCFVHVTRALAAERPTVLLVDDIHFAPEEGRALFAALAAATPGHRVLLVGATRPGLDENWTANIERVGATRLALPRLGPKDLVRLLRDTLKSHRLAEELVGRIAVKSDGNPYFVFEILRGLREGRFIARADDGTWSSTGVIEEIRIPSSILELVQARVADLDEDDRNILDVASCLGFQFDPLLVGAALGIAQIPLMRRLAHIEKKHRLVRATGREFAFDHHQVQEALYSGMPELLREPYHLALAEAIEARERGREPKDVDGARCVDLAEHFLRSAAPARALPWLAPALTHLERNWRNEAAADLAERALEIPGLLAGPARVDILLRRFRPLVSLGRRDPQLATAREAVELADASGDAGMRGRAKSALGRALFDLARYVDAEPALMEAMALSREAGDARTVASITGTLCHVAQYSGNHDLAQHLAEELLAASLAAGDKTGETQALGHLASVASSLGRHEEARGLHERQLALIRATKDFASEIPPTINLGNVLLSLGRLAEAAEHYERGRTLARERGVRHAEGVALVNLGSIGHLTGDFDAAREALNACLDVARPILDRRVESYALHRLGVVARCAGEPEESRRLLEQALALRRRIGYRTGVADSAAELGSLHVEAGREAEARALFAEAVETARAVDMPGPLLVAVSMLALLPGGDVAAARAEFARLGELVDLSTRMEIRFLLWRASRDAADLAEAKRLLDFLVAHSPEARRGPMVAGVPLHRGIAAAAARSGA